MTNELKPCLLCEGEAKLFRRSGTVGRVCPSKWYRERVECKVCGLTTREYKSPGAATRSWNTRPTPVAPVSPDTTGKCGELVTYRIEAYEGTRYENGYFQSEGPDWRAVEDPEGDYVTRSQAVELLAAERAEKEIAERNRDAARENFLTMQKSAAKLLERAEKAEADNAALTARVKELRIDRAAWEAVATDIRKQAKALEAKLTAAEKALTEIASFTQTTDLLWWQERARAALGGKP